MKTLIKKVVHFLEFCYKVIDLALTRGYDSKLLGIRIALAIMLPLYYKDGYIEKKYRNYFFNTYIKRLEQKYKNKNKQ